ncbi:MAG: hypothetical protein NUW08_01430, partial [Candidatus Uhrbacteria bacterium]|nr:hypothetical protein [Candidatus Uhrbacteria bacterium]
MRTTIYALFIMIMVAAPAAAQDRGVSIPDAHTLYADDAFVAQEVTAALRTAGGMAPNWRLSTVDVPFAELLRACETDVAATLSCMAEQVMTRDPSMRDALILFVLLERNGGGMAVLHLNLRLYDMRTGELAGSLQVDVQRITAPAARNREAADWIRRLLEPPRPPEVAQADEAPIIVLDLQSVEGDDNAAQTVSHTLRANAAGRAGWIESDRAVTLAQMILAHGCDEPDRACMSQIGVSLQPDRRGILIFGRMRR